MSVLSSLSHCSRHLLLALAVFLADQTSKMAVLATFAPGERLSVLPCFDLVLVYNTGASFSLLADASGWQRWFFLGLALTVATCIIWIIWRHPAQYRENQALALILGGALGNALDRAQLGKVVDFLDVHWGGIHWPAFNVADSGITVGAIALILLAWFSGQQETRRETPEKDVPGARP